MVAITRQMKTTTSLSFWLFAMAAACLLPVLPCGPPNQNIGADSHLEPNESKPNVSVLFDFHNYQQLFKKRYGSYLEVVTRKIYFLARAFKVYVAAEAFRYWMQSYYLALNEFSDWSPQELAKMTNTTGMGGRIGASGDSREIISNQPVEDQSMEVDPKELAEEIETEIDLVLDEIFHKGTSQDDRSVHHREKRQAPPPLDKPFVRQQPPPRHLPIDSLIKRGGRQPTETVAYLRQAKINKNPRSNNRYYDALAREGITHGLIDQQEGIELWALKGPSVVPEVKQAKKLAQSSWTKRALMNAPIVKQLTLGKDKMFADLRLTGCWFPPRHQGECSSCYAFAAISMMEFLFCRKTGQLVAFSEQYMINCGKGRVKGMEGCAGARGWSVPRFIQNFGLELQEHYSYLGVEEECPYDNETNLKTTGFIRLQSCSTAIVDMDVWDRQLKYGPLFVNFAASDDFFQYAGGVYDGHSCSEEANHIMVVVGHGRESGQEFWLLRNSYGTDWGHDGYFKLAKSAPSRCIELQRGYAFATADGKNYVKPEANERNAKVIQILKERRRHQKV